MKPYRDERGQDWIDGKRIVRMAKIDALPSDVRECVHDYGMTCVQACLDLGITKSRHIRHLVETVLNEFSPTRGSSSAQGPRGPMVRFDTQDHRAA